MFYPQLYEYWQRLEALREWDGRSEFAGLGLLFLGGGVGGLVAGEDIESFGVAICLVLGVVLFGASLFIRRANADSVKRIAASFARALSEYEVEDPEIRKTREHYDSLVPVPPTTRWGRVRRFFNF